MMRILLIGGFGFLGRQFIEKFHSNYEIIVFNQNNNSEIFNIINSKNIIIERGKIENNEIFQVMKKYKPDITLHFAAMSGLKKCEENPFEAFVTNVIGTFNVTKACLAENSKLIFLSSREVYGETIKKESSEDDSLHPLNVYGITKMLAENIILNFGKTHGLNFIILRLTNVYGPGGEKRGINRIINSALQTGTIEINGGNQTLNLIYVDDVIDIINIILDNPNVSNQILNIGSNNTVTIDELSLIISDILKHKIKIEYLPKIDYEVSYFKPDLKKWKNLFNQYNPINLEDGLKKTIVEFTNQKIN